MSRIPPSLEYFVIYNKTLQSSGTVSKDDDDAQEEAHILFYTCRPGGVKRDKMLRQIGLAKALISFSEAFTNGNGEACEMVHSARTKLVMVSPEKEYWIHACVNVAYTERKNKDGTVKKEYHEASVHDIVLKTAVLRAYQEFKLLHGTFGSLLSKGRSQLERHLEKFFAVWAWKWDIESPAEFISHLGIPLSAYCKYLSPLIEEVQAMLPDSTPVVLLSPANLLASSPPPSSAVWTILPSHLIHLIPPYEPPPETKSSPDSTVNALTKIKAQESMLVNQTNTDLLLRTHAASGGHSTVNFLAGMPSVKKWTGFLTFSGKSRSPTPRSAQDTVTPPPPPTNVTSATSREVTDSEAEAVSKPLPAPSWPDVDQQSLEEALQATAPRIASHNGSPSNGETPSTVVVSSQGSYLSPALEYLTSAAGGFFGAHPPKAEPGDKAPSVEETTQMTRDDNKEGSDEAEPPKPIVDIIDVSNEDNGDEDAKTEISYKSVDQHTVSESSLQCTLSHMAQSKPTAVEASVSEPSSENSAPEKAPKSVNEGNSVASQISSRRSSASSSKPAVLLPPPEAFFVPLSAYLEEDETHELRLRRVYHMSLGGVMLALVVQSPDILQSPTDTGTLSSRRFASFGGVEVLEGLGYPAYTDLPRGLEYMSVEILRNARRILDKWEGERGKDGSSTNAVTSLPATSTAAPGSSGMRRFAVSGGEDGGSVLASLGFSSTSGWLFEGQSTLRYEIHYTIEDHSRLIALSVPLRMVNRRDKTILEQFSRTTTSQSWYISKRILSSKQGGHEREVHMEVAKKDSNLVDVDNDLATIVRRLDSTSY